MVHLKIDSSLRGSYFTMFSSQEVYSVYGNNSTRAGSAAFQDGTTTISSHTASALSRLTLSSQSQSISPFRSYGSRMNSPSFISQSRLNSPSLSHSFLPHRFVFYFIYNFFNLWPSQMSDVGMWNVIYSFICNLLLDWHVLFSAVSHCIVTLQ